MFPMYLIVGVWGGERRVYATVKFFLYTIFGSAFLLVAIPVPVREVRAPAGVTFACAARGAASRRDRRWLFVAFFVAFAVKVPLFPLHTWLPTPIRRRPLPARSSWPPSC